MNQWLTDLFGKVAELPPVTLAVLAGMAVLGIVLIVLMAKKAPRSAQITVAALLLAALVAACWLTIPVITADLESGGTQSAAWLYSPTFWSVVLCLVGLVALVFLLRRTQWTVRMISAGALCIALSFILDCITLMKLPQGGSITPAAMLPILFFAWSFGVVPGITAGVVHGLLGMIAGAYVIHPLQFLLDYIFPFAMLGLAGLFQQKNGLIPGIVISCFLRFLMHFLSGYIYFGSYAPEGQSAFIYSLTYNGSFMLVNTVICLAVYLLPPVRRMLDRLKLSWTAQ